MTTDMKDIRIVVDPSDDPAAAECRYIRTIRRMGDEELRAARHGLADDALVTRLGLRDHSLKRAKRQNWQTVGQLRDVGLRDLAIAFGKMGIRDVFEALEQTGMGLRCKPTTLELFDVGVLQLEDLVQPDADETPVTDLYPWCGAVVERLKKGGTMTLGQLRALHRAGKLGTAPGVGKTGAARLHAFLMGTKANELPVAKLSAGDMPANSVFSLGGLSSPDKAA